jgi:hypothetical protein
MGVFELHLRKKCTEISPGARAGGWLRAPRRLFCGVLVRRAAAKKRAGCSRRRSVTQIRDPPERLIGRGAIGVKLGSVQLARDELRDAGAAGAAGTLA